MSVIGASAWCELVTEMLRGKQLLDQSGYSVLHVGFVADDTRWTTASFLDGQLHHWGSGRSRSADLAVVLPSQRWLADTTCVGPLLATSVFAAHGDSAPLLDASLGHRLAALPRLPHAVLDVLFAFTTGPFGPFDLRYRLRDGQVDLVIEPATPDPAPDVVISLWFGHFLGALIGDRMVLAALERGGVHRGSFQHLMLLAGVIESDAHLAALRAHHTLYAAVARHGDLLGAPALRTAARAAAQEDPP